MELVPGNSARKSKRSRAKQNASRAAAGKPADNDAPLFAERKA
jgi:hypothetical protein